MEQHQITVQMALDAGFTNAGHLDLQQVAFRPEVRDMCADNLCHKYGTSWVCPPGCGSLEEVAAFIQSFDYGMLLQVTGTLQNSFDMVSIDAIQEKCRQNLKGFLANLRANGHQVRGMSTAHCELCETCTYPDAPCRFPDQKAPSLEACGMVVSDECTRAGIEYYYGPNTMTFTVAILVNETK
ncbi:MAG: DUF2284 domain-containing protein [Eubacteriales bacterium]